MPPVPAVPGASVVKALQRHGFVIDRIQGSHHIMRHPDGRATTVPVHHGKDLAKGTLRGILRDVGMTVDQLGL
jgi:Predicted periplasmic or secreted lipoprotein